MSALFLHGKNNNVSNIEVLFGFSLQLDSLFTDLRLSRQPISRWKDALCVCTMGQYITIDIPEYYTLQLSVLNFGNISSVESIGVSSQAHTVSQYIYTDEMAPA